MFIKGLERNLRCANHDTICLHSADYQQTLFETGEYEALYRIASFISVGIIDMDIKSWWPKVETRAVVRNPDLGYLKEIREVIPRYPEQNKEEGKRPQPGVE